MKINILQHLLIALVTFAPLRPALCITLAQRYPYWSYYLTTPNVTRLDFIMEVPIEVWPAGLFENYTKLKRISLFGKPIHLIEEDAFHGLRTLRFLELVACSLKVMPPVDPVKSNLAYLNLRKNNLVEISPDYFSGFTQLYRVSLAYNRLIALPNFKPVAETLRSLYLDYNNITSLRPSLTNATFPKLFLVHVMYNKISRLNHALFRHLPRLGFLRVDFNLLETLEDMSLMSRENALEISVNGNPWNCNQSLSWIRFGQDPDELYQNGPIALKSARTVCAEPPRLKGKKLAHLHVDDFHEETTSVKSTSFSDEITPWPHTPTPDIGGTWSLNATVLIANKGGDAVVRWTELIGTLASISVVYTYI